jgi:hypothetical protein
LPRRRPDPGNREIQIIVATNTESVDYFDSQVLIISIRVADLVREERVFIDNLLVQIHPIIDMILLDRPYAMGV